MLRGGRTSPWGFAAEGEGRPASALWSPFVGVVRALGCPPTARGRAALMPLPPVCAFPHRSPLPLGAVGSHWCGLRGHPHALRIGGCVSIDLCMVATAGNAIAQPCDCPTESRLAPDVSLPHDNYTL